MAFLSLDTDSVICQSSSMYLLKLLHVFVKEVAVVDRTRQQKSTLLSLDTDSVTTLAFMATSGGHQGGNVFLGIVAYICISFRFGKFGKVNNHVKLSRVGSNFRL